MGYQALLFSSDEKASRLVTQVLGELEFRVESCSEPFAAVKQITSQHYDAIVVDCDDEQNAALLFKSARNSNSNANSLAVALVQGQGGIARAFRIGANLILTKPINVEQSKSTLRTAKGLLRKAEASKLAAAVAAAPRVFPGETENSVEQALAALGTASSLETSAPPLPDHQPISIGAVASGTIERQPEEFPELGPAEAAFIASMPEPVARATEEAKGLSAASANGQASAATAAAPAMESDKAVPEPAAPATALEQTNTPSRPATRSESFAKPALASARNAQPQQPGNSKNLLIAAVLVLAVSGAIYYAWPQLQPVLAGIPIVQKYLGLQPPQAPAAAHPQSQPAPGTQTAPAASDGQTSIPAGQTPPANNSTASQSDAGQPANSAAAGSQQLATLAPDAAAALLAQKVDPVYPPSALQQKVEGSVQLQAEIGKDGTPSNIKVLSGKPLLAAAAIAAVRQWKYKPYQVDGQAAAFQTQITLDFKLPQPVSAN